MEYCVITFSNTHTALTAEKNLKDSVKIVILPTPREISKGCGIAIRFSSEDFDKVSEILLSVGLSQELYRIYSYSNGIYTPL